MTIHEAMQLMHIIAKRQLPDIEATLIAQDNRYIIRLYRHEADDRCCTWYIMCPRDWAIIALEEAKAR